MRILLDTNVVLMLGHAPDEFPSSFRETLVEATNLFVSSISRAEIGIKISIGKLHLPRAEGPYWSGLVERLQATELAFNSSHASRLANLPLLHRDPFDRMLISQCLEDDLTLATTDRRLGEYGIRILR